MKRFTLVITTILLLAASARAQENTIAYRPGNGIEIRLDNGDYTFRVGGLLQPVLVYSVAAGGDDEKRFSVRRGLLSLSGEAREGRVGFALQVDFARNSPLLDAYLTYRPWKFLALHAGQRQSPANNREMTLPESALSMTDYSLLSRAFSSTGRAFGIFVEGDLPAGRVVFSPALSVTSGDGMNAFGTTSTDVDLGGLAFGGRLDVAPLGRFAPGNDRSAVDISREPSPRLKVGVAGSYNRGASHATGDGHGAFTLYDVDGRPAYPDYRRLHVDLLFKYRGFTLLGEYASATATALDRLYTAAGGAAKLQPGQISHYLALGDAFNVQAGYILPSGWAVDARYTRLVPEFPGAASVFRRVDAYEIAVARYLADHRLKVQCEVARESPADNTRAGLLVQILF
ncbi:MAG: OprO/OprP family phosphate-selective porin [Odoribacteraceae bacterium]|jgi:hypothetical protein|nr:OprO/OprP family phosphate-selective porin [Odoribacteraceae bacterium]